MFLGPASKEIPTYLLLFLPKGGSSLCLCLKEPHREGHTLKTKLQLLQALWLQS